MRDLRKVSRIEGGTTGASLETVLGERVVAFCLAGHAASEITEDVQGLGCSCCHELKGPNLNALWHSGAGRADQEPVTSC